MEHLWQQISALPLFWYWSALFLLPLLLGFLSARGPLNYGRHEEPEQLERSLRTLRSLRRSALGLGGLLSLLFMALALEGQAKLGASLAPLLLGLLVALLLGLLSEFLRLRCPLSAQEEERVDAEPGAGGEARAALSEIRRLVDKLSPSTGVETALEIQTEMLRQTLERLEPPSHSVLDSSREQLAKAAEAFEAQAVRSSSALKSSTDHVEALKSASEAFQEGLRSQRDLLEGMSLAQDRLFLRIEESFAGVPKMLELISESAGTSAEAARRIEQLFGGEEMEAAGQLLPELARLSETEHRSRALLLEILPKLSGLGKLAQALELHTQGLGRSAESLEQSCALVVTQLQSFETEGVLPLLSQVMKESVEATGLRILMERISAQVRATDKLLERLSNPDKA